MGSIQATASALPDAEYDHFRASVLMLVEPLSTSQLLNLTDALHEEIRKRRQGSGEEPRSFMSRASGLDRF